MASLLDLAEKIKGLFNQAVQKGTVTQHGTNLGPQFQQNTQNVGIGLQNYAQKIQTPQYPSYIPQPVQTYFNIASAPIKIASSLPAPVLGGAGKLIEGLGNPQKLNQYLGEANQRISPIITKRDAQGNIISRQPNLNPALYMGLSAPVEKPMQSVGDILKNKPQIGQDLKTTLEGTGMKTKKLVERMQQSERYPTEIRQMLEGNYIPKSNVQTISNAKKLVSLDPVAAEARAMNPQNAVDQAIGAELFNYHMDNGNIAKANQIINATSGTNEGQMVQILSQYDKTTPQGAIKFANNAVKSYNKLHPNTPINITDQIIKDLYDSAKSIQAMPQGRERNIASGALIEKVNNMIPSSIADKAITIWKAGLLTSLRTTARNLVGNTLHGVAEIAKDIPTSITDQILALRTGQRSMTLTGKGLISGTKEGLQSAKDIITTGFDPTEAITKFDIRHVTWGNNVLEKGLKKYTDFVFRTLGAQDKPFWSASFGRSLYDQAGAKAINAGRAGNRVFIENLVKNPTQNMLTIATRDANIATFHDQTTLSKMANSVKDVLSKNEFTKIASEIFAPFTGVPSAIASQTLAYSPVGLIKGIFKAGKVIAQDVPSLQRQASQEIGRGVVGTGIFGLGAYLASKGLITGQPKDATEARQWQLEGKQANSIFLGGKWRSINSIGPENIVQLAGAKLVEELSKKKDASLGTYLAGLAKDQLSQTFLAGVQQPLNAITDPVRYGGTYLKSQVASIVPNIIKDFSKSLDPYMRETNNAKESLQGSIPVLRNKLLPKRDALGNIIPQEPTGVGAFIDLFNSKSPIVNQVVNELGRLNNIGQNATPSNLRKDQTIGGVKMQLTPEQLNLLESQSGPKVVQGLTQLFNSSGYQSLSDEEKAKAVDSVVTQGRKQVKGTINITQPSSFNLPTINSVSSPSTNGQYIIVNQDTGTVKKIDLSKPLNLPTLTSDQTINKKLVSGYRNDLNTRINDIIKLYQDGQMSIQTASNEVSKLQTQIDSLKVRKPRKIAIRKIKIGKIKIASSSFKPKSIKMPKIPNIKITKKGSIKLGRSKNTLSGLAKYA